MTPKRQPSVATILTRAAKAGAHLRVIMPDGTIIETLTGSAAETPMSIEDREAAEADKAFDVAFDQSVRKSK